MSSRAHLNSGRAKIGDFREMSRAHILSILDSISGNALLTKLLNDSNKSVSY